MKSVNHRLEQGQSLIELAFGFMFILLTLLGMIDLGRLYFLYIALEDSASEAALYLAINGDCLDHTSIAGDGTSCASPNNALYRAQQAANQDFDWQKMEMQITPGVGVGSNITVTLSYPVTLMTPIISNIVGDETLVLTAQATQPVIGE